MRAVFHSLVPRAALSEFGLPLVSCATWASCGVSVSSSVNQDSLLRSTAVQCPWVAVWKSVESGVRRTPGTESVLTAVISRVS